MIQNCLCCTCYGLRAVTMSPAPTSLSPSTKAVPPPELPHRSGRRRCQLKDPNPAMSPSALSIGSEPTSKIQNGNHHCLRKHPNQATPKVGPPNNKKNDFSCRSSSSTRFERATSHVGSIPSCSLITLQPLRCCTCTWCFLFRPH